MIAPQSHRARVPECQSANQLGYKYLCDHQATTQIISLVSSDNLEAFWEFYTEAQLDFCSPCRVENRTSFTHVIFLPDFRWKLKIKFYFESIKLKSAKYVSLPYSI